MFHTSKLENKQSVLNADSKTVKEKESCNITGFGDILRQNKICSQLSIWMELLEERLKITRKQNIVPKDLCVCAKGYLSIYHIVQSCT